MKMYQVLEYSKFFETLKSKKLPFKVAYKLQKIQNYMEGEVKYYQEQTQKLIEEFGKRDESGQFVMGPEGNTVLIQEDKLKDCQQGMTDLLNIDVVGANITFSPEELEDLDLEYAEIELLMPFIQE